MTFKVTWAVNKMKRDASTGGILSVYWECRVSDDIHADCVSSAGGKLDLVPDATSANFVAYDDLTEDLVLSWVHAHLGEHEVSSIEADRASKVEAQILRKETVAIGLPWDTSAPV